MISQAKGKLFTLLLFFIIFISKAQERFCYKKIDGVQLDIAVYTPNQKMKQSPSTAAVFFFGGGWNKGSIGQFIPQAKYLNRYGVVCFLVDYRVKSRHQTTPIECVKDAKSAIRYIRAHHKKFNIDPNKIVAGGGSAGGHLAACTALIKDFNEENDLKTSAIPNALLLFNPVMDLGPESYLAKRRGRSFFPLSPLHHIKKNAPPCIVFLGTKDKLIPVSSGESFQETYQTMGNHCVLKLYENQGHGFFNAKNKKYFELTMQESVSFLKELKLIKPD